MIDECCLFCRKSLENALPDELTKYPFQPYAGGDVLFVFSYGSTKFDKCTGMTTFKAYVCDDCAEKHVTNLTETRTGMDGEQLIGEDFIRGCPEFKGEI